MKSKYLLIIALFFVLILGGVTAYFYFDLQAQKQANEDLQTLAELNKQELEKNYSDFSREYEELKLTIKDDSLLLQIEKEQEKIKQLQAELKKVKNNSFSEITRLKKELETVRGVLRSYIIQVDSLQQENLTLTAQRDEARAQYSQATSQISTLNTEKANLTQKVAIAAQLDATGVTIVPQKNNGKSAKRVKDIVRFLISFTLTKNITAETGNRTLYIRLTKPGNEVINKTLTFPFENKQLEASASKTIEYNGEEQQVSVYVPVTEFLSPGSFQAYIFANGKMIGSGEFTLDK